MKKLFIFIAGFWFFISPAMAQEEIIATAGDIQISHTQLLNYLQSLPEEVQESNDATTMQRIIDILIQRALLEKQAEAEGVDKRPEVQNLLAIARQTVLADFYLEKIIQGKISDQDVQEGYQEYIKANPAQSQVKARHILLNNKADAEKIIQELNQGGDFTELAKARSEGPSAPNGGDLGYFTKERMVPEFAEAAFAMEKNTHSETPVQTQFGWHVILVEDKRDDTPLPIEDIRPQLEQALALTKIQETLNELTENIEVKYLRLENLNPQVQ